MKTVIEKMITDVLSSVYSPFGFAVLLAFLFMFFYMEFEKKGFAATVKKWYENFKEDRHFRQIFWLAIYVGIMLVQNFYNKNLWMNPLSEPLGGWWIYNEKGELKTGEVINLLLYIPFIILLFRAEKEILFRNMTFINVMKKAFVITLLCSVLTELVQLLFRLQYVRLSDVVYNVIGGILGGLIFYISQRKKGNK